MDSKDSPKDQVLIVNRNQVGPNGKPLTSEQNAVLKDWDKENQEMKRDMLEYYRGLSNDELLGAYNEIKLKIREERQTYIDGAEELTREQNGGVGKYVGDTEALVRDLAEIEEVLSEKDIFFVPLEEFDSDTIRFNPGTGNQDRIKEEGKEKTKEWLPKLQEIMTTIYGEVASKIKLDTKNFNINLRSALWPLKNAICRDEVITQLGYLASKGRQKIGANDSDKIMATGDLGVKLADFIENNIDDSTDDDCTTFQKNIELFIKLTMLASAKLLVSLERANEEENKKWEESVRSQIEKS